MRNLQSYLIKVLIPGIEPFEPVPSSSMKVLKKACTDLVSCGDHCS